MFDHPLDINYRRLAAKVLILAAKEAASNGRYAAKARQFLASDRAAVLAAGLDLDVTLLNWLARLPEEMLTPALPKLGRIGLYLSTELAIEARQRAQFLGVSVSDLVRGFLAVWAGHEQR